MIIILICIIIIIIFIANSSTFKGFIGESKVVIVLGFLDSEYIILHNIFIKTSEGLTSQIDHLVLSEYGLFVIETKNYKGWIFGREKSEYWVQVIFKKKYKFRNPIKQNWAHIFALKNILSDYKQINYFPIVVFSGNATLKEIVSTVPVIYDTSLNQVIKSHRDEKCLTTDEVLKIKNILMTLGNKEKDIKKEHIRNIHQIISTKQLRKEKLICPYCNSELKLRYGKYGKFYGCSNYPNCKFTMKY